MNILHDFESGLEKPKQPERIVVKEEGFLKTMKGRKDDKEKPDWSLLPLKLLTGVVKVLTFGKAKYDRNNWMHVPDAKNRYSSALMRHFSAWQSGEKLDEETKLSHLYHMGCCLVFLIWFEENTKESE